MKRAPSPSVLDENSQENLREVVEAIASELELRPLLTKIVRYACELLEAEHGVIGLVDDGARLVRTEAVYNTPPDELGTESPEGIGLAGRVLATKIPVVLARYGDLERPTRLEMLEHTVIGMPVVWRGDMIGFFGVSAPPPRRFTPEDVETLGSLARHAAIAVHNAQQFEREKRRTARVTTVSYIGKLITEKLSLADLLQTAARAVNEHLSYTSTGIFLVDTDAPDRLVLKARSGHATGVAVGEYAQRLGQGVVGSAAEERKAIFVPDVHQDPRYITFPGSERLRSELAVPIVVGERLLGVLNVESEHKMDHDDIVGFGIVADQLGVAIDNARLFAETEAALSEMHLLYETSRRMSGALEVRSVVEAYLEQVALRRRYGCTVFIFTLSEAGEREEIVLLGRWRPETGITHYNSQHAYFEDAFDAVLDLGQTVTIEDAETDPRVSPTLRAAQRAGNRPALALIPLMVGGRRIGGVSLSHPQTHAWSEADLRPYQVTAAQLATTLYSRQQQERLLEQEQHLAAAEERRRLSRELHDSVTQLLFSMTLIAQSIGPAMEKNVGEGETRVAKLLELAQKARVEMRSLLVELRVPSLPERSPSVTLSTPQSDTLSDTERLRRDGLAATLRHLARQVGSQGLRVYVDVQTYKKQAAHVEEALFRIAQEALHNAVKHANATRVDIVLTVEADAETCRVVVQDNGDGFDESEKPGHFGLGTMRERAEALRGRLELSSNEEGTRVTVVAPVA